MARDAHSARSLLWLALQPICFYQSLKRFMRYFPTCLSVSSSLPWGLQAHAHTDIYHRAVASYDSALFFPSTCFYFE